MKQIREIVQIVSKDSFLLDSIMAEGMGPQLRKLFNILMKEPGLDEDKIMLSVYGKKSSSSFALLKGRMLNILSTVVFIKHIHKKSTNERTNLLRESYKLSILSVVLKDNELFSVFKRQFENNLKKAIKNEILESVILQSRFLISYYAINDIQSAKYIKYIKILNEHIDMLKLEIESIKYFGDIYKYQINRTTTVTKEILERAYSYYSKLNNSSVRETLTVKYNKYLIVAFYYEHYKEYKLLLTISKRAIKELGLERKYNDNRLGVIVIRQLLSHIQLGQFKIAMILGINIHMNLKEGSYTWYRIGYYLLKAQIYYRNYGMASEKLYEMMRNSKFNLLPSDMKELYFLLSGYMYFLDDTEHLSKLIDAKYKIPEFRIAKFLNEVPTYSKDKRGINVSILILHASFLIQRKKFDEAIDRIESLNRYAGRYLRRDDTFRSNCMIKMLVQMAKADFHPIKTERYAANLRAQLDQVPVTGSGGNIEVEIIPFEVIWEVLIKSIQPVRTPTRRRVS